MFAICQKCNKIKSGVATITCPNCMRVFHMDRECLVLKKVTLTSREQENMRKQTELICITCGKEAASEAHPWDYNRDFYFRFCPLCGAHIYTVCCSDCSSRRNSTDSSRYYV